MDTDRDNTALTLQREGVRRIIRSGNGDAALLWLYLYETGSVLELSEAAKSLGRTETEIAAAAAELRRLRVFPASAQALPQPEELPEYSSEEITRRCREDSGFHALVAEAQRMLGHILSGTELKTLFGVYNHLGLGVDTIMVLIHYCTDRYAKRYGEGRRPTMRYIEREAYTWVNRELMTCELAEAYIKRQEKREEGLEQVRKAMGLTDRALSASEKRYIEEWLDLGFSPEAIEMAYDRTVTNTGSLKWKYMNSIIQSWHAKGLLKPDEIERLDRRNGGSAKRAGKTDEMPKANDRARMERMIEKLRNK